MSNLSGFLRCYGKNTPPLFWAAKIKDFALRNMCCVNVMNSVFLHHICSRNVYM